MDAILDEIESLEAILMDDVKITKNEETGFPDLIETTIFPTVGEDVDTQYVCVTLQVMPVLGYPDVIPRFKLRNPRGLDDKIINAIDSAVKSKLVESLGQPVVFDLINIIREHLTESNLPTGQCVICLYGFQEGDQFTKTMCYHYLHSHCLSCHILASKHSYDEELKKIPKWKEAKPFQALCPVCRDPLTIEIEPLLKSEPPKELQNAPKFRLTNELKSLQAQMNRLYMHQKSRGGIIDLDAEENNVISLASDNPNNESSKSTNDENAEHAIPEVPPASNEQQQDRGNNSRHFYRGLNRHHNNHVTVDAGVAGNNSHHTHHYGHRGGNHFSNNNGNRGHYGHNRNRRGGGGGGHGHHHNYHNPNNGQTQAQTQTTIQSKSSQTHVNNPCGSDAR